MAYMFDIPKATDQLSISQGQLLANFNALGAIAGSNANSSASLNVTSGFNWVYLPTDGRTDPADTPPPAAAFAAGENAIYSVLKTYSPGPQQSIFSEIYINKTINTRIPTILPPGNIATPTLVQIPMTEFRLSFQPNSGWTYLPSGLKIVWGTVIKSGGVPSSTFTYANLLDFPGFQVMTSVPQLTLFQPAGGLTRAFPVVDTATLLNFSVRWSLSDVPVGFTAQLAGNYTIGFTVIGL
jgi:hypothetical protein